MNIKHILFFLFFPLFVTGQQEPFLTSFRYQMNLINPAYAGAESQNMVAISSRNQWNALENSPKNQIITFSSQRKNNVGLGVSIGSSKFFVERNTSTYIDFSYRLSITQNTNMFLGLKGGATFYKSDLLGLYSSGSGVDPAQGFFSRINPNLGVGVLLQSESFWLSLSIPRLFSVSNEVDFSATPTDKVHSYIATGGIFQLNDFLSIKPSMLIRSVETQPETSIIESSITTVEFLGMVGFKQFFDIGLSYRTNNAMGIISFIKIKDFLDVGYAYETSVGSTMSNLGVKTHELTLRFRLRNSGEVEQSEVRETGIN